METDLCLHSTLARSNISSLITDIPYLGPINGLNGSSNIISAQFPVT
jgi:hypothetical protein